MVPTVDVYFVVTLRMTTLLHQQERKKGWWGVVVSSLMSKSKYFLQGPLEQEVMELGGIYRAYNLIPVVILPLFIANFS